MRQLVCGATTEMLKIGGKKPKPLTNIFNRVLFGGKPPVDCILCSLVPNIKGKGIPHNTTSYRE